MDAHYLSLPDNSFDIVVGNGILHHLEDLNQVMHEIYRVLKPNGIAVFTEPLGMNPLLKIYRKLTPKYRTKDEKPFTEKELKNVTGPFKKYRFVFFDFSTFISKALLALGMKRTSKHIEKSLIQLDDKLMRSSKDNTLTFWRKMAWRVVMQLTKE